MRHIVIMAGGSGTRFWPLSRRERPKQLLPLWGDRTLMELTFERLRPLVPAERIYVVTGEHLATPISKVLPDLPRENLIVEPCARNTLPCIGLAAAVISQRDDDATLGIFSADHFVGGDDVFRAACDLGDSAARDGKIGTLGIRPTRPETGYGYIHHLSSPGPTLEVAEFVEKPDAETAERYLADGHYLWNAGIFFLSLGKFDSEIARQQPVMARRFDEIRRALSSSDQGAVTHIFEDLESISIDYGIMEAATQVVVIPAEFEWNDVGHWGALDEVLDTDSSGNVVEGSVCGVDVRSSVLINRGGEGKLLAVVGVEDLVVIDTPDATLVLPRAQAQRVREVVAWLKRNGGEDLL